VAGQLGQHGAGIADADQHGPAATARWRRSATGGSNWSTPGLGALNWLPDIERRAHVMAALVAPGGRFYLAEFDPFADVFGDRELTVAYPYFRAEPFVWDEPGTYADPDAQTVHNRSIEWNHGLGAVVSALVSAGPRLEFLHEHDHTLFARWPFLKRADDGPYRLPEGTPSLPLMYSLLASAP
jgi:hypothetical protein